MWEAGGGKHHSHDNEVANKRMLLGGDHQDGLLYGGHPGHGVEQQQGPLVVQGREVEAAGCEWRMGEEKEEGDGTQMWVGVCLGGGGELLL